MNYSWQFVILIAAQYVQKFLLSQLHEHAPKTIDTTTIN